MIQCMSIRAYSRDNEAVLPVPFSNYGVSIAAGAPRGLEWALPDILLYPNFLNCNHFHRYVEYMILPAVITRLLWETTVQFDHVPDLPQFLG